MQIYGCNLKYFTLPDCDVLENNIIHCPRSPFLCSFHDKIKNERKQLKFRFQDQFLLGRFSSF